MIKNIVTVVCLLIGVGSYAQNLKTGVLVVGSGSAAMAAAIQSAKSGVKTILMDAGKFDAITLSPSDRSLKVGIYADFADIVDSLQKSPLKDNQTLTPEFTAQVFKTWTDTLKNLTVLPGATIKKIKKSGKGWEIDLVGREIKADIILDATTDYSVAKVAFPGFDNNNISSKTTDNAYRTSVAIASADSNFKTVPLAHLISSQVDNIVLAAPYGQQSLRIGQAAGATAAYSVFFKTNTKNLNVRVIQTELLTYKSRLIKFDDIDEGDSSMIAFQHIGVTGILKGKALNGKLLFLPDSSVTTEELKQPLKAYYSRSHVWFLDNTEKKLTVGTALSLIKFLASRGEELGKEVEKGWKTSLKLKSDFDLKKLITRRELTILLDTYLQPYTVAVDMEGNVRR